MDKGIAGACVDGTGLDTATSVTISPDGKNAYVASVVSDAVAIFDRNTTTGAVTQKPGTAGCISETGSAGACTDGTALDSPQSVTISPDGASAYAASANSDAVTIFDRDTPPQTTINSGPTGGTNDNTPTFTYSSSEAGSTFECKVDGGTFDPCSGPGNAHTAFALADGPHQFQVRAIDPASNTDPTPATQAFTVDTNPPDTTITKKPKTKIKTKKGSAKVTVEFTSEAGATFQCQLDKAAFAPFSSPFTTKAKSRAARAQSTRSRFRQPTLRVTPRPHPRPSSSQPSRRGNHPGISSGPSRLKRLGPTPWRYGAAVSYEETVGDVAKVVEAVGVAILVFGGVGAFGRYARELSRRSEDAYTELRRNLGRVILLGLEVLIIGDIIRTIVVEPTLESVGVLGVIVLIRIVLSFSLEVEIDGAWPWNRWRTQIGKRAGDDKGS